MDRYERILTLHRILKSARYPVTRRAAEGRTGLLARHALSRPRLPARRADGAGGAATARPAFRYDAERGDRFELPGLWLNSEELHALLAAQQLLLAQRRRRAGQRAGAVAAAHREAARRHQDRRQALADRARPRDPAAARALDEQALPHGRRRVLERKQLTFDYRARSTDAHTARTRLAAAPHPLPRQLVPRRLGPRSRSAAQFRARSHPRCAACSTTPRATSPKPSSTNTSPRSYGIFSGTPKAWATIVFSAKAARWVADEHWHSQQQGRFLPDGRYELKVPYSDSRELLMDVLHYGSDAEIVEPPSLREQARSLLSLGARDYDR